MSTSKLKLYNDALLILSERRLSSLAENKESRRILDDVWDGDAVLYCLEHGQWNFACRSIEITYSPSVEPPFGYARAFSKPDDWVRTMAVCTEPYFKEPLRHYTDEAGFWFADPDTIYIRHVSSADEYGNNMGIWPATFANFVSAYLADRAAWRITQSNTKSAKARAYFKDCEVKAKSNDAMNEPTGQPAAGSWVRARQGRGWSRGSRNGSY